MENLLITSHAWKRISGRRICEKGIFAAIEHGRRYWNHGRLVYRLDRRCISKARGRGLDLQQYEGIHVVLGDEGQVVTVYKNKQCKRLPR